jgi:hypothetical protein
MSGTSSACAMPADLMPPNFDAILEFAFLNANCHSIHFLFYGWTSWKWSASEAAKFYAGIRP